MNTRAWKEALFADRGRSFTEFVRSLLSGIPWSERAEEEERITLDVPASGLLQIDNAHGRTRVLGEDREDLVACACKVARAESQEAARQLARAMRLRPSETAAGGLVEVEVPRRWNRTGSVHLELRVPRDIRVEVTSANGRVHLQGLRASSRAHSSNGAICVTDVTGDVEIETSNARICCVRVAGRLLARSANGKIQLDDHRGAVDASTSNGLIHARLAELGAPGVQLATSNGRIVVELPESVDADLDLRVDNGFIRNQRELDACSRTSASRLVGRLGHGGCPIRLCATNGSISVR